MSLYVPDSVNPMKDRYYGDGMSVIYNRTKVWVDEAKAFRYGLKLIRVGIGVMARAIVSLLLHKEN